MVNVADGAHKKKEIRVHTLCRPKPWRVPTAQAGWLNFLKQGNVETFLWCGAVRAAWVALLGGPHAILFCDPEGTRSGNSFRMPVCLSVCAQVEPNVMNMCASGSLVLPHCKSQTVGKLPCLLVGFGTQTDVVLFCVVHLNL